MIVNRADGTIIDLRTELQIIQHMDNKNRKLADCYNEKNGNYRILFLKELEDITKALKGFEYQNLLWNHIKIGRSLNSLAGLPANDQVKALIRVLTKKVFESEAELDCQAIGNALYGLQNMDASSIEVKSLLKVLTKKIDESEAELNVHAIGNALYGLQKMDSSSNAVKLLLKALTKKIFESEAELNARSIGLALFGMQNMDASSIHVKSLLMTLENKFPDPFLSIDDNQMCWCQCVIGYLFLAKNAQKNLSAQSVRRLFPENENRDHSVDEIERQFCEKLLEKQIKNGALDLHYLDYKSAKMLVSYVIENKEDIKIIITGIGKNSKHENGRMRKLILELLHSKGVNAKICSNIGRLELQEPTLDMQFKSSGPYYRDDFYPRLSEASNEKTLYEQNRDPLYDAQEAHRDKRHLSEQYCEQRKYSHNSATSIDRLSSSREHKEFWRKQTRTTSIITTTYQNQRKRGFGDMNSNQAQNAWRR